ncbi:MAG TPA: hypothetical protein VMF66_18720 [Candidatus Acidoferrum sp.]|nr:hypothetical protein [Candidatus Acidoferrum sp.]
MPRSAGVTVSAVVVFIGSALTLLFGAFAVLGLTLVSRRPLPNMPLHAGYLASIYAIFVLGFAGWGIASGIGLLNTREWARISTVVFAAILALLTIPTALFIAFIPLPFPRDPSLPSNFAVTMRVSIALFYGLLGALAVFWIFFFNRASVKDQFQTKPRHFAEPALQLGPATAFAAPDRSATSRPLSITIISWLLIIGSAFAPLSMLYSRTAFHGIEIPLCFLGFFLFGRTAALIMVVWMAAQVIAAVGLLKLQNWARLTTIGLQLLGIINAVLMVGIPANRLRFQHIMDAATAFMNQPMAQPMSSSFPVWIGMLASLPLFVVVLWFLITRKHAFTKQAFVEST